MASFRLERAARIPRPWIDFKGCKTFTVRLQRMHDIGGRGMLCAAPMRFYDCTWMDLGRYLEADDRVVLPLGSVEQHAYLSLGTDAILAERAGVEAAEPCGVPVLPAVPFGLAPTFTAYPGTISLGVSVYLDLVRELLDALHAQGFRRILIVNGHAGNAPAESLGKEWMSRHRDAQVLWHALLLDPAIWSHAREIDADAGHASWVENFPWTRVAYREPPAGRKAPADRAAMRVANAEGVRRILGDGNSGGPYAADERAMLALWEQAVASVRGALECGWRTGDDP
jgi:creatinine amidohydrolase